MSNILAIVGRPNVGKSTLFNRLTGMRQAIVDPTSGVTRDRHYGRSDWNGVEFSIIDTGGYVIGSDDIFESEIRRQVELALEEADVILFMVDTRQGLMGMDQDISELLRRSEKKTFVAANKADSSEHYHEASEFYSLGIDQIFPISAMNGSGTGELLDAIVKEFKSPVIEDIPDIPKIAVIGRPNVGKSSLVNALLGKEQNIVTPIPGTTRDSVYTRHKGYGFDYFLVDTAGVRKKSRVSENIEFYSVMRSIRTIENSDVCLLMVDAEQGFESQDTNIFSLAQKNHKGIIIVVNKWDLIVKSSNTHKEFEALIRQKISPFSDVPIVFTSVLNKQRIHKTIELAHKVYENRRQKITTSKLNELLLPIIHNTPPPVTKGKVVKIKYITQLKTPFPAFVFFCNLPKYIKEPYKRFIENQIRKMFDFSGAPIELYFRDK
ncbi:MAG: ribosome biogenesis GTPase Der [Bacteroidales bacterium]|jgi:GTP-binding protein|nr:ribosome biogenesis GTPase Der [Bacteroidales bacterium]